MTHKKVLIRGGTVVTMNSKREILEKTDILIEGSRIQKMGAALSADSATLVIDASGQFVAPGMIQVHTHLCQALFRGQADDLALLDWLKNRIWPFEFAHNESSIRASSQIALLEMQLTGTTSILDMGTVRHTNDIFLEVENSGMRFWGGKCLMDLKGSSGPLFEERDPAIGETRDLIKEWHHKHEWIEYAVCPRFAISCSDEIMKDSLKLQKDFDVLMHTHASESEEEVALIKKRTGFNNVDYLDHLGLLNEKTVIVHGVHLTKEELAKMVQSRTPLVHCPSSNLKLASGIAPIESYVNEGLTVGLGSDGAPCNNTMDAFKEMHLTALLQKPKFGPTAMAAERAFELATLGGAKVLGKQNDLGSLEVGKWADVITVERTHPSLSTVDNPYSALVYSASGRDVNNVLIHGRPIVLNKKHQVYDREQVTSYAREELNKLLARA